VARIWRGPSPDEPKVFVGFGDEGIGNAEPVSPAHPFKPPRLVRAKQTKVRFRGKENRFKESKDAYVWLLNEFINAEPNSWATAREQVRGRGRLYFAKSAAKLFINSPHLVNQANNYQQLLDGWMANVNLDDRLKAKILTDVASISGLSVGKDWTWEQERPLATARELDLESI
jgi:hypothetical protein